MKRHLLNTVGTAVVVLMASSGLALADQARPRSPGASGGSSGGSSGGGGGARGGDTGRTAAPRDGGSTPWGGGGSVSSRPTRPSSGDSSVASTGRRGGDRGGTAGGAAVPGYSRPREGAAVTGRAMPRANIGTLPPIIAGPVYWGANDAWYFYPWGFGGLGLGYMWDPWFWGGYGGYWGGYSGFGGYGGYPYGGGYGGYTGYTGYGGSGGGYSSSSSIQGPDATGGLRLRVSPRSAEVHVDGYFAGTVDDFDGAKQKLKLPPGPHRVEIKADGYETLAFDVLVVEDEVTTYKGDLARLK
jgi:hypothetical protein